MVLVLVLSLLWCIVVVAVALVGVGVGSGGGGGVRGTQTDEQFDQFSFLSLVLNRYIYIYAQHV